MRADEIPFVAIGSDELGGPIGETIQCRHCGGRHPVENGEEVLRDGTKRPSNLIQFYRCSGTTYLAGIGGKVWK